MPRERNFWLECGVTRHRRIPVSVLAATVNALPFNTGKSDGIYAKIKKLTLSKELNTSASSSEILKNSN